MKQQAGISANLTFERGTQYDCSHFITRNDSQLGWIEGNIAVDPLVSASSKVQVNATKYGPTFYQNWWAFQGFNEPNIWVIHWGAKCNSQEIGLKIWNNTFKLSMIMKGYHNQKKHHIHMEFTWNELRTINNTWGRNLVTTMRASTSNGHVTIIPPWRTGSSKAFSGHYNPNGGVTGLQLCLQWL